MYTYGYRYICMDLDIDIYVRTCIQQQGSRCRHGQPQPRARLRGRSRRAPTPCAARACPAATADRCANRALRAAWAHHRLMLQQLSVCTAHGVCDKHREQQGWHEQHKHAHAAQVDSSAHGRWPRLRAGRWVGTPALTSRIGGRRQHATRRGLHGCGGQRAYRLGGGGRVVAMPPVAARTELAISATPRAPTASTPSSKYHSAGSTDATYLRCICATRIGPQCSEGASRTRTWRRVTSAARRRVARTGRPARLRAAEWTAGRPRTRRPAPTPQQCARRRAATISAVDENRTHSCGGGSAANVRQSSPLQVSKLQRCACAPWQGRPQAVCEGSRTAQPH